MKRVLLLDDDEDHAELLALALHGGGYSVTMKTSAQHALVDIQRHRSDVDVVIVKSAFTRREDWNLLECICRMCGSDELGPSILCVSPLYSDPRIRLEVERRVARLVYER